MGLSRPVFSQNQNDSLRTIIDTSQTNSLDTTQTNGLDTNELEIPEKVNPDIQTFQGGENDLIYTAFGKSNIKLEEGQIISNILKIYNNSDKEINFRFDIIAPGNWKRIELQYENTIAISDTVFLPIVLIPGKDIEAGTEIIINAFILDEDGNQIGSNYFSIRTEKMVSWQINIEPSSTFYFKNNENSKRFNLNVANSGNSKQDIFVSYKSLNGGLILKDTNGNIVKSPNYTLGLDKFNDTILTHVASITNERVRNHRKIATVNYIPNVNQDQKKYTMYINSSEANGIGDNVYKKGNRVNFIKLPNETNINEFGYAYLPLTVEANFQNILDENAFMSLNLRGFKQLNSKASINYFAQLNYNQSYYTSNAIENSPWYIGYFDDKKTLQIGQTSSDIIGINGIGKGIRASYSYLENHKTGAFYVKSPGFFKSRIAESYGLSHSFRLNNNFRITGKIGGQTNQARGTEIQAYSIQPNFNILKKHYFNLIGAFTNRTNTLSSNNFPSAKVSGALFGANYSSNFLDKKLRINLSARYNDKEFSSGSLKRNSYQHRTIYNINEKWDVYLANRYQNTDNYNPTTNTLFFKQELLTNSVVFSTQSKGGAFQPGLFYDYRSTLRNKLNYRGASIRYSTFDFIQNYLTSASIRAGYSRPINASEQRKVDFFTLQFSSIIRYKVWNFTMRYNYGLFTASSFQNRETTSTSPQDLRLSLQNQYQFKNEHLVLETSGIYNYNNSFNSHVFGLFPKLIYFTNSGWMFSANINYNFSTRKYNPLLVSDTIFPVVFEDPQRTYTNDVFVGASVRKEFGVPIPFVKNNSASIEFVAFYDINGNRIKDGDEPAIENVVMRLGTKEVMSQYDGTASIKNIPIGTYPLMVFSLEELKGWFPNTDDSILVFNNSTVYIPFARGIKVYGDVVLDRQKIAVADTSKPFDLSRIKITASNGKVFNTLTDINGRFEFYMPNGDYTITMDENILGNRYKLSRNNIPLQLKNVKGGVYVSFFITEKRKKVVIKEFGNPSKPTEEE